MKSIRQKRPMLFTLILGLLAAYFVQFAPGQAKAGWQEEWSAVVAKAKQEGKVMVWGPPGQLIRKGITDGFRKAFPGISIEYTGNRSSKFVVKLRAERKGGVHSVDVLLTGASTLALRIKPSKALDPIGPALILPEVTDPSKWRNNHLEYADTEQKYVLSFVSMVSPVMNYNPKQVKPSEIDELYELLDPKWKGKILINDPIPPGAARSYFHWLWKVLGPEKAKDFYKELRAQAALVSREQRRQIEWVARGKYPILVGPSHGISQQLLSQGVKFGVAWDYKDYGSWLTASFGAAALVNRAPNPNAAKVLLNWILGQEGQIIWSKNLKHLSRRLDVPTDYLPKGVKPKAGVKYINAYLEQFAAQSPEEQGALKQVFGR